MAALHAICFTQPRPWTAAEFAEILARPGVFLCLADRSSLPAGRSSPTEDGPAGQEEGPAGFLLGRALAGEAELLTLAVDPRARRRGTGAALVAEFLSEALHRHATRAFLEVAETNAAARALYARMGFGQVGRRRGYFAAPGQPAQDAIVMARDLPLS